MTRLLAPIALVSLAALVGCDREPNMPPERAAAVQEARTDVAKAQKDLSTAERPKEVVGAAAELSTAATEFQRTRDKAIEATRAGLEQTDRDVRHIVDVRSEIEFQDRDDAKKTDAAIKELVAARTELEATLHLMRVATVDTWNALQERVDALNARIRSSRQAALDGLY